MAASTESQVLEALDTHFSKIWRMLTPGEKCANCGAIVKGSEHAACASKEMASGVQFIQNRRALIAQSNGTAPSTKIDDDNKFSRATRAVSGAGS